MPSISLQKSIIVLAVANLVAAAFLVTSFSLFRLSQNEIRDAHTSKYQSFLLADELRQSSDDLTRLGRTYVTTANAKYEKQYFDILAIRNGKKPRPLNYHRIYWDFFTVDMSKPRKDGPTVALSELMKQGGFTEEEFAFLNQAQANSDGLVNLEVEAMNAVKGKFPDEAGKYTVVKEPDLELARRLVHSEQYHKFKADIMRPLNKFFVALETRTQLSVDQAEANAAKYGLFSIIAIFLLLLVGCATLVFFRTRVIAALTKLKKSMVALSEDDLSVEVSETHRKNEIGDMARAVESFKNSLVEKEQLQIKQRETERRMQTEESNRADERRSAQGKADEEKHANEVEAERVRKSAMLDMANTFESNIMGVVGSLNSAATEMQSSAETMSATADQTNQQAIAVAAASEEATVNVQTVASAAEQLSASIEEIGRQVTQSNEIAQSAVEEAEQTNAKVEGLAEAAQKIGDVVNLINDIASQTNLLALNATIEAARAGEAGKGFAVVASEVKSLATQTGKATEEIGSQITAIQAATGEAVGAIQGIESTIGQLGDIATSVASAVSEQGSATREIASSVQQAATGTQEVTSNIAQVTQAASESQESSGQILRAAKELAQQGEALRQEVDKFLGEIRAA